MPLALNLNNLSSRAIRLASSDGGVRRIATNATASRDRSEGGILAIYDIVEKFGQSLMSFAFNAIGSFFQVN